MLLNHIYTINTSFCTHYVAQILSTAKEVTQVPCTVLFVTPQGIHKAERMVFKLQDPGSWVSDLRRAAMPYLQVFGVGHIFPWCLNHHLAMVVSCLLFWHSTCLAMALGASW